MGEKVNVDIELFPMLRYREGLINLLFGQVTRALLHRDGMGWDRTAIYGRLLCEETLVTWT